MIVKDNMNNSTPPKSCYAPVSTRAGESSGAQPMAPPPTYDSTQSYYTGHTSRVEPAGRRFWKALLAGIAIWILLGMLVHSIADLAVVHRHRRNGGLAKDYPEFETGEVRHCIDREDWPSGILYKAPKGIEDLPSPHFHTSTSLKLPSDADVLYFLSRGSLASGSVYIQHSDLSDDSVHVDVGVWYWTSDALDRASVCALERGKGKQHGVGIFTPSSWPGRTMRDRMVFEVTVRLPARSYAALEADYLNFKLHVADLQGIINFEKLNLKTSNAHILAKGLETNEGYIKSSNGAISGEYNVTNSLELVTSNAKIDANIEMHSENSHQTKLLLKTSNGEINSDISLNGPVEASSFDVQARTSNKPALVYITSHPVSAPLTLEVKTSNARAHASLHKAFEGPFTLRTSNAGSSVTSGDNEEDPSGDGRHRTVDISRKVGGALDGKTWWGEWTSKGKGWAHISSSNMPVSLDLSGRHS